MVRSLVDIHDDDPNYRPIQSLVVGGFGERLLATLGDICEQEFGLGTRHPDLLIVDLALSPRQTSKLSLAVFPTQTPRAPSSSQIRAKRFRTRQGSACWKRSPARTTDEQNASGSRSP